MNFLFQKTLHIFYILILGIFIIKVKPFTPQARAGHSSILVGDKLYFFGGNLITWLDEVFYLDTSQTFSIASQPWVDLTASAKIPFGSSFSTVSLINTNNDNPIIYLFGGEMRKPVTGQ